MYDPTGVKSCIFIIRCHMLFSTGLEGYRGSRYGIFEPGRRSSVVGVSFVLKAFVCLAISRFSSCLLMVHSSGDRDRLES